MKLVIIAAGKGSRLQTFTNNTPKTLLRINGDRIIDKIMNNCIQVGIEDIIIVTGYLNEVLKRELGGLNRKLNIEFIHNPKWELPNGLSVLTVKPLIPAGENFLISMSDHIYDTNILKKIIDSSSTITIANVGLDFKLDKIFDINDGMKVKVDRYDMTRVVGMGKNLTNFDAIDCGVFKCSYEFFNSLEKAEEKGNYSLSDACNILIREGKMGGIDIGNNFWIDIDTVEAIRYVQNRKSFSS